MFFVGIQAEKALKNLIKGIADVAQLARASDL